jgi:hypothetical protein
MTEHGRPSWYSWVVVVMVPILASIAVLVISLRINEQSIARETEARRQSEQAFCGIIIVLDDANRKGSPTTEYGRELARRITAARAAYRCP